MVNPVIKEKIFEDLEQFPPELQRRAQELVHGLLGSARLTGVPGASLLSLAGIMDEQSAREIEEVIEEGCEDVDHDAW